MKFSDLPRINFWPYDLFGYLFPGALFLTGLSVGCSAVSCALCATWRNDSWRSVALLVFVAYIAGTCIASLASYLLERVALRQGWLYPTARFYPDQHASLRALWFRKLMRGIRLVTVMSPGYRRAYSPVMQQLTEDALRDIFGDPHHPVAYKRANHFLELYGFSRNCAMSFFLLALLPLLSLRGWWYCPISAWAWTALTVGLGLLFYMNYTNVFRRMNNEVYRGLVTAWKAGIDDPTDDQKAMTHFE